MAKVQFNCSYHVQDEENAANAATVLNTVEGIIKQIDSEELAQQVKDHAGLAIVEIDSAVTSGDPLRLRIELEIPDNSLAGKDFAFIFNRLTDAHRIMDEFVRYLLRVSINDDEWFASHPLKAHWSLDRTEGLMPRPSGIAWRIEAAAVAALLAGLAIGAAVMRSLVTLGVL
jgi:hypothetical protein